MKFKQPSEEQLKAMEDFATICSEAIEMVMKYEVKFSLQNCTARLQEAMGHFNAYIINGGKLMPAPANDEQIDKVVCTIN